MLAFIAGLVVGAALARAWPQPWVWIRDQIKAKTGASS